MSFLQLQQQSREKCQEIWDRQIQSLSAVEGDENESDSEANSDLDSFAGDLENLLDAEEGEEGEEGNVEMRNYKSDGVKGLKMRRHPSQARLEEEREDEAAEAAELCRMLMDGILHDTSFMMTLKCVVFVVHVCFLSTCAYCRLVISACFTIIVLFCGFQIWGLMELTSM